MQWIDLETWKRRRHYDMFKNMDAPHYHFCADVDITQALNFCKSHKISSFVFIIHQVTRAVNSIENFRYRIRDDRVCLHDKIDSSFTVLADDELYYHCTVAYQPALTDFAAAAQKQIHISKAEKILLDSADRDDLIYLSCIPWIKFTSASHAMHYSPVDSVPRFYWGKYQKQGDKVLMPFSVQAHHALVDGLHMGKLFEVFQQYLNEPESAVITD